MWANWVNRVRSYSISCDSCRREQRERNSINAAQISAQPRPDLSTKNLALQPEAFKLARRLGARFSPDKSSTSVVAGTLTIGSEARTMEMTRTQTNNGETVEIGVAGFSAAFLWDAGKGGLSSDSRATENDRELVERLVFDSPDQFVLMQLRGASYTTIARGVRPADATGGYFGPLWTVVRVDDPEPDETKRALSPWRLYYLNTRTGLIDRIESEVKGKRILAEISWTERNGEKLPAQIVWSTGGQTLMQYSLTNFSLSQK
jgi:hypothetical protein